MVEYKMDNELFLFDLRRCWRRWSRMGWKMAQSFLFQCFVSTSFSPSSSVDMSNFFSMILSQTLSKKTHMPRVVEGNGIIVHLLPNSWIFVLSSRSVYRDIKY